jgi:hypothetical protein
MFKDKLTQIKDQINNFTNNKPLLMFTYIQRKLDRSLDNYLKELELNIDYLLYRDPKKVKKWVGKQIDKGEL